CSLDSAADHRDLPSFPTRRSSDLLGLLGIEPQQRQVRIRRLDLRPVAADLAQQPAFRGEMVACLAENAVDDVEAVGTAIEGERGDRKSTRLNSSHVKISYAVFCLK